VHVYIEYVYFIFAWSCELGISLKLIVAETRR